MSLEQANRLSFTGSIDVFNISPVNASKKRVKKYTDPNESKQSNPYFIFCKERRTQLQAEHPSTPSREITKLLAEEWKGMNQSEKEKYKQKYKKSIEEYNSKPQEKPQKENFARGALSLRTADGKFYTLPVFLSEYPTFL